MLWFESFYRFGFPLAFALPFEWSFWKFKAHGQLFSTSYLSVSKIRIGFCFITLLLSVLCFSMKRELTYPPLSFLFFIQTSFWAIIPIFNDVWALQFFWSLLLTFLWIFTWNNLVPFRWVLPSDSSLDNLHRILHWNLCWPLLFVFDALPITLSFCFHIHKFYHLTRTYVHLFLYFILPTLHKPFPYHLAFF